MPYLTILLLLVLFLFLSDRLATRGGLLFTLPEGLPQDGANTDLVVLIVPMPHETMAFFDDARYLLADESSMRSFSEALAARVGASASKTLLVLADRRVKSGELMAFAEMARQSGVQKLLVSERHAGGTSE